MPAGVEVSGSGVQLHREFGRTRLAFSPEVTDHYGFAFKAAVARALFNRAAVGVVGGGGGAQREVVVNFGWHVTASQRLLLSAASTAQQTDLSFESGLERHRLQQASAGGAYNFALRGTFEPRLDVQAYVATSGGRDLGSLDYFKDDGGQAQIFRQDRRVAGALLTGAQTRASFSLRSESTLTVSVGAERLRYALATGDESTRTLTRGVEWVQRFRSFAVRGQAGTQAAMHTTGLGVERRFQASGQGVGVTLTRIDGRNGVADDLQLQGSYSVAFGSGSGGSAPARARAATDLTPGVSALVDEVSRRPSFLPLVVLAVVDRSRAGERLVAIDHAGMVPGTRIDGRDGTLSVPTGASIILEITRNLLPFANTGQFSAGGGELQIHTMAMEVPASDSHRYLVSMRRPDTGVTTVSVDVTHGSVHITRVTVTAEEPDTTPDAFAFAPVPASRPGTVVASAAVPITGLGTAAPISITGGEYSIDGGSFTESPGVIRDGGTVSARVTTSTTYGNTVTAAVKIGSVSAEFTVATEAADATPGSFGFVARNGVGLDALVESDTVIVAGINVPAPIAIAGGDYSVNGGPFSVGSGMVSAGDAVRLRLRSSAAPATLTSASLTMGGVIAAFNVTTAATSADTTPDAFSFTAQTGAMRSTLATSSNVIVSGINTAAAISIGGGHYSIDAGAYTNSAGSVSSGQAVRVQVSSAAAYSTATVATLTIGGVSGAFTVTTVALLVDTTPDAFTFVAQTGAARSSLAASNSVTVRGIDAAATIAIAGGQYSIDAGAYTSSAGTVANGQTITIQVTSAAAYSTPTLATLTVGGVSGAFMVTTEPIDTTPEAFGFAAQAGAALSTLLTSNSVSVSGINTAAAISIAGGQYSIDDGAYTSSAGTVANGQTVTIRLTSAAAYSTPTLATLTVGGVSGAFTVTTAPADTTPAAFSFTPQVDVGLVLLRTSNSVSVSGLNAPTPISIAGGQYRIGAGAYTSGAGTVSNGQSVTVQVTSPSALAMTTVATLTIGGVSGGFSVSTEAIDTTPTAFSFVTRVDVRPNDNRRSEPMIISGFNSPAIITVSGPLAMYNINGGEFTGAPGVVRNGDAIRAHHRASGVPSGETVSTVTIGGVSGTFTTYTCGTIWGRGCGF